METPVGPNATPDVTQTSPSITLRIDNRETKLIDSLTKLILASRENIPQASVFLRVEALPIGDIVLTDHNGQDCIIVERKTVSDLISSIKDGRYEEQSFRLSNLDTPLHNIIYLIEGEIPLKYIDATTKSIVYSTIVSLMYYKGFSVFRTSSIEETAYFLQTMATKLLRNPNRVPKHAHTDASVINTSTSSSAKDYISVSKRVKKNNVTNENIGEIMLCQIPGVSTATSKAILSGYNNLPHLIHQLREDATVVEGMVITNANGQSRKIGKNVVNKLRQYLIDDSG